MVNHCDVPETIDMSHMTTRTGKPKKQKVQIDIQSADIDTIRTNNGSVLPALKVPTELGISHWCDVPMDWYPKGTLLRIDHKGKVERPFTCIENVYAAIKAKHGSNQSSVTIRTTIVNAINNKTKAYGKYWVVA
jgi:hypothetical protein